jgi:hypothetical protein
MAVRCEKNKIDTGGEGGIRTPGTSFSSYNGLANRRLQPLGHLSAALPADCRRHLRSIAPKIAAGPVK